VTYVFGGKFEETQVHSSEIRRSGRQHVLEHTGARLVDHLAQVGVDPEVHETGRTDAETEDECVVCELEERDA